MKLTSINLSGVMQGPIWWPAGAICETEFNRDFAAPNALRSRWQRDWQGIDEALQAALSSGDFQGGMGKIVYGSITFTLCGNGRQVTISKPLENMHAAREYMAEA